MTLVYLILTHESLRTYFLTLKFLVYNTKKFKILLEIKNPIKNMTVFIISYFEFQFKSIELPNALTFINNYAPIIIDIFQLIIFVFPKNAIIYHYLQNKLK